MRRRCVAACGAPAMPVCVPQQAHELILLRERAEFRFSGAPRCYTCRATLRRPDVHRLQRPVAYRTTALKSLEHVRTLSTWRAAGYRGTDCWLRALATLQPRNFRRSSTIPCRLTRGWNGVELALRTSCCPEPRTARSPTRQSTGSFRCCPANTWLPIGDRASFRASYSALTAAARARCVQVAPPSRIHSGDNASTLRYGRTMVPTTHRIALSSASGRRRHANESLQALPGHAVQSGAQSLGSPLCAQPVCAPVLHAQTVFRASSLGPELVVAAPTHAGRTYPNLSHPGQDSTLRGIAVARLQPGRLHSHQSLSALRLQTAPRRRTPSDWAAAQFPLKIGRHFARGGAVAPSKCIERAQMAFRAQ